MLTQIYDQLKGEGFCLLRLCEDLRDFIQLGRKRKTYLYETQRFLDYIINSLTAVEKYVRNIIGEPPEEKLIKAKLRDFGEIKKALSWLYVLTKEAIDSDSLSIPFSLATFTNQTGRKLLQSKDVSFVVLGGSALMYYKYNLKKLRDLTSDLSARIPGYPILDENVGILTFPYCAAREVLVNCNLFHEMGHYIYEKTNLEKELRSELLGKFSQFFLRRKIEEKVQEPLLAWRAGKNYVSSLMLRWADEIFADVLAIRVLGPAFHFALREIEQIIPTGLGSDFSETHPADDYRFRIHATWLINDEWEDFLKNKDNLPEFFEELEKCKDYKIDRFSVGCRAPSYLEAIEAELNKWMLGQFDEMVGKIEEGVSKILGSNFEKPVYDFMENNALVTSYLEHGVVPSTLYKDEIKRHPHPITVLNSGYFFYLKGMTPLLERVITNLNSIDKRITYEKLLNSWLGKAIEDWQILLKEKKL